jgi:hypothetical protein
MDHCGPSMRCNRRLSCKVQEQVVGVRRYVMFLQCSFECVCGRLSRVCCHT